MSLCTSSHINNGWLNIYKDRGISSNDVLKKLKRKFSLKKLGHYGTLDPLASGVLPIAIGEATKTINFINNNFKKYSFTIIWGKETDTCDAEGKVIKKSSVRPKVKDIKLVINQHFTGIINQKPPIFSAVKINGVRAYKLARKNIKFETKPKKINIIDFNLRENIVNNHTKFRIKCSSGTYIRSIARDLSNKLDTFGYAENIIREENSFFTTQNSINLNDILDADINDLNKFLLPVDFAIKNYPSINLEKKYSDILKAGNVVYIKRYKEIGDNISDFFLVKSNKKLVSIANLEKGYIIPRRNFIN
ncbi:MAG: tRNA pseudouridine(55) synthase TruB [Rickettsiales bacterium]|nr:tRNA pseudouridine(55) synthase TruB [Rickettsiales bacterium]